MASKKPAIQLSGVDDIIRVGAKAIKETVRTVTRAAPRTVKKLEKQGVSKSDAKDLVYGNAYRAYGKGSGTLTKKRPSRQPKASRIPPQPPKVKRKSTWEKLGERPPKRNPPKQMGRY
jgi:hypothetical protein